MLRGHDAGAAHAAPRERGPPAVVRRVPPRRPVTFHRRDPRGVRRAGRPDRVGPTSPDCGPAAATPGRAASPGIAGRRRSGGGRPRVKEGAPAYAYEDEDQSRTGHLAPGVRVRHEKFGVGTVVSVDAADGDTKLVVRFAGVGAKRLLARYANLEVL